MNLAFGKIMNTNTFPKIIGSFINLGLKDHGISSEDPLEHKDSCSRDKEGKTNHFLYSLTYPLEIVMMSIITLLLYIQKPIMEIKSIFLLYTSFLNTHERVNFLPKTAPMYRLYKDGL